MKVLKNLKVRDIMTRGVITVQMDASVREVVKTLAEEHITGAVVVAPDGGVMGIISEMDVVKAFNEDIDKLTAEDIMSDHVKGIHPQSTIKDAAEIMKKEKIHRLVVVHEREHLGIPQSPVGILCASDIIKLAAEK
ncbi:hypothetical protein BEH94_08470 [Candidatus Altiarchaeales archaeon WOR_SM1_SCG]|nr:hypothetical protein BEH94_08470 [Candidatus Altiarchaeales archaeon WOR_SM1_SCG]